MSLFTYFLCCNSTEALKEVFAWLGFDVHTFEDLSAQQMKDTVKSFREKDHADCFICCILTHSESDILYSTDGHISANDLLGLFSTENCPALAGKPKVFVFQGCQTGGSHGINPPSADFLCCIPTIAGHYSLRNTVTGSFFIQSLCRQLKKHCPR